VAERKLNHRNSVLDVAEDHPSRWDDIVRRIGLGETVKEIAFSLGISPKTVEYHWATAKAGCNFQSVVDAVHYALAHGWIQNKYTACARPRKQ
jgi:DNA-binding NarL/FixJ family response regulator